MPINTPPPLPTKIIGPEQSAFYSRLLAIPSAFTWALLELEPLRQQAAQTGEDKLAALYLTAGERESFSAFAYAKRRFEWLGGRIAAKRAVAALTAPDEIPPPWQNWTIAADGQGRPFLASGPRPEKSPEISISHSGGMAAGMAAYGRCGLDLQEIVARLEKVREKFCRPEEGMLLATAPALAETGHLTRLTMLWAAKESFRKALVVRPLAGFLELRLEEISGVLENGLCLDFSFIPGGDRAANPSQQPLRAVVTKRRNFILAFTVLPEPGESASTLSHEPQTAQENHETS